MKRKLFVTILAGLLIAFSLAGCSGSGQASSGESQAADQLSEIKSKGKMIIGLEGNWSPWSYHDEDDNLKGFDADVARAIGEKLGVEVELVEAPWESLFAGLDSGRYDAVINGVEVTEERAEKYQFSEPYAYINTALIIRNDNTEIKTFEDLKGKKTVNSLGSTYMDLAESYGASAAGVSTLAETLENVISGRADATLNADVSFYDYMSVHPDAPLKIAATTEDASLVCVPIRKDSASDTFAAAVSDAIKQLREDGTLSALSVQYFGGDITGAE
mgnify:CR=1 FL=1